MEIFERKVAHDIGTYIGHEYYPKMGLPLHKHAEYEIIIFKKGLGKEFVGDGVASFEPGDLTFIGSHVPHLHLYDVALEESHKNESFAEGLVFAPEIFPQQMATLPDYEKLNELLQKSEYGIRFSDKKLAWEVYFDMQEIDRHRGTERLIFLLQILDKLSSSQDYSLISNTRYNRANSIETADEPVNKVFSYLFNHFQGKISLTEIAGHVGKNPTALCRYFKRHTGKSIFQILIEIRIGHACQLLSYSHLTIAEIAFKSGYNNVNLFNRQFFHTTQYTPTEYRKQIHHPYKIHDFNR